MCAKNVVRSPMIFPANLKLNPRMNIRFGVHSPQNLTKKHISLSLKTIDEDIKPAGLRYSGNHTNNGPVDSVFVKWLGSLSTKQEFLVQHNAIFFQEFFYFPVLFTFKFGKWL